jgi:P2-related tail formation protein
MIIVGQWNSFWDSYEKKVMVINSININKTKESLNSDGQQFHQYQ